MKTIGFIGGISWQSTAEYYRLINQGVNARLGGNHSARIFMHSVDFHEVEAAQFSGGWRALEEMMCAVAVRIQEAGADFLVIGANTMHKVAPAIGERCTLPIVHIADVTGAAIHAAGLKKVGLLGTRTTMVETFYRDRLSDLGISAISPQGEDVEAIHRVIHEELVKGDLRPESREKYLEVMGRLKKKGAEGVILGCTEIPLLIKQTDTEIPVFDTTALHAAAVVERALS